MEALARSSDQGAPSDYSKTGYDLGHMAPSEDFAWNEVEQRDSFSMANVAPQSPGLNRQAWERLEEDVRAWALARGNLEVYTGPIYGTGNRTIGKDRLLVPSAFYKVVVDTGTGEFQGFILLNRATKKGPLTPWRATLATIENQAHLSLRLPHGASESRGIWVTDLSRWRRAHKLACRV